MTLAADAPFFEEIGGIAFNVDAIQCVDGDDRDLGMSLLVDLGTDVGHLRNGGGIQNVCEIVDISGRLQLGDRLGPRPCAQRKQGSGQAQSQAPIHSQIVQDAWFVRCDQRALESGRKDSF